MNAIRIVFDEEDFKKLISGGVVSKHVGNPAVPILIILSDIGYERMMHIIKSAQG